MPPLLSCTVTQIKSAPFFNASLMASSVFSRSSFVPARCAIINGSALLAGSLGVWDFFIAAHALSAVIRSMSVHCFKCGNVRRRSAIDGSVKSIDIGQPHLQMWRFRALMTIANRRLSKPRKRMMPHWLQPKPRPHKFWISARTHSPMPAFRFEANDIHGEIQRGLLEADSARAARSQLRAQNLIPLVIEPAAHRAARGAALTLQRRLSPREQALFIRQMASLLTAGLPVDEALGILCEQAERVYVRELIAALRAEVLSGQSLAGAFKAHPRDFPDIYRALVAAG